MFIRRSESVFFFHDNESTVKHVLSGHSKIDKMKVLKTGGSLMQVGSILQYFIDLH